MLKDSLSAFIELFSFLEEIYWADTWERASVNSTSAVHRHGGAAHAV